MRPSRLSPDGRVDLGRLQWPGPDPKRSELATLGTHSKPVVAVDLSADGNLAATGSHDGTVRIWSLDDKSESSRIKIGERVGSVAFHPLKSWLAVSGATSDVGVYDPDGTRVALLNASTPVTAVGWTGDGEFLIGVGGNAVRLWSRDDLEGGQVDRGRSQMGRSVCNQSRFIATGGGLGASRRHLEIR
ncbi:MAG TPA: hypothetical protein VM848_05120 [Acidimicrobiia bacterium]|nr:hypothetical protein [Acidimicrobiia bacterium]